MLKCLVAFITALLTAECALVVAAAQPGAKSPAKASASAPGTPANGDTVQLRDKASLTGTILAEKPDQVVVDMGYTVLVIPRSQVVKITKASAVISPARAVAMAAEARHDLYATAGVALLERSVRDLVQQLGEAVVQVRTPSAGGPVPNPQAC